MGIFSPKPGKTDAYHKDSASNEYFGSAPKGVETASAGWQIFVMWKTGDNWIILWPVDTTTGKASDQPKFIWDNVEGYTFRVLGT
jgi:hypothetical protein